VSSAVHEHLVAPSILAADFGALGAEVATVLPAVPWLHVDVMDGHYVPNLTLGPDTVKALRSRTTAHLDTHMMVSDPRALAPKFIDAGSDSITFHLHTDPDPVDLCHVIHDLGAKVAIAIKPQERLEDAAELLPYVDMVLVMSVEPGYGGQSFIASACDTMLAAEQARRANGWTWRLQVDGGVDRDTVRGCARSGADTFVAGSSVFKYDDRIAAVGAILAAAADATSGHMDG
jgi:ribulose-phosphate 3-epimerase